MLTLPLSHQQLLRAVQQARPYHLEQPVQLHLPQEVSRVVGILSIAVLCHLVWTDQYRDLNSIPTGRRARSFQSSSD
jgi:hypothetical protein